jgi:hypothetical protein
MLDAYGALVKKNKCVQKFLWEGASVDVGDEERYRTELMDPKWRKTVSERMKRAGFIFKEFDDGFSIEIPEMA